MDMSLVDKKSLTVWCQWKQDNGHRETTVMQRYHLQNRDDYTKYNKLCGSIRQFAHRLSQLDPADPVRRQHEALVLAKLEDMGILTTATAGGRPKVSDLETKMTVAAFCRRRLPVVMCKLKMAQTVGDATSFIEQGHVRIGPQVVTDPAFLVTVRMEDFVTWVDSSKIRKSIRKYRNEIDDYLV